jgi:hypothetical protein
MSSGWIKHSLRKRKVERRNRADVLGTIQVVHMQNFTQPCTYARIIKKWNQGILHSMAKPQTCTLYSSKTSCNRIVKREN